MERRTIWAILLMMVIAIAPAFLIRKTQRPAAPAAPVVTSGGPSPVAPPPADSVAATPPSRAPDTTAMAPVGAGTGAEPADTVHVIAPRYSYDISTRGGQLISARLTNYKSLAPADHGAPVELIRAGDALLGLALVGGGDTVRLSDWTLTPSVTSVTVDGPSPVVTFTGSRGGYSVELTYAFKPDYQIDVSGRVSGLGPNGGLALVSLGTGIRNAEADSAQNARSNGFVVKDNEARRNDFSGLKAGVPAVVSGPFEWVAVKSKYFVEGLFAFDPTSTSGRVSGVTALAPTGAGKHPVTALVRASLPVPASGALAYSVYAGPLEHPFLARIGHDFDDVNPYGWPGFRTAIRFFSVPVRWMLVAMHEHLHLAYGVCLILFGLLVRVLLWPLNQKAMRSNMQLQAVQPMVKAAQERYKDDPAMQQKEMFRLYREHKVNPMGGCWPMLLPMPILLALFVVFQYSIELRGASFLWLPDLASKDPFYILPIVMGLSMLVLSKVGQKGMPPNPQMQMTTYVMPIFMTVIFLNFASGLNLYYAVSNIASIPQQWMLAQERLRRMPPAPPAPAAKAKPARPA